jgi:drug/metabolite transporter (DMT)-like permease
MWILIAVMTLWGCTFVLTKDVIGQVPPLTLAFLRVAIGFLILAPVAIIRRAGLAHPRPALPWGAIFVMGCIGVSFYYGAFNLGLFYTSASQGALVQSSIPAVTALIAVLWIREHASRIRIAGIALSVAGVLVIFSGSLARDATSTSPMLGNFLVFLSVIAWGLYTSLAKRYAHVDALVLTAGVIGAGALLLLPIAVVEMQSHPWPQLTSIQWAEVLLLGAGASGLAYMFYNLALQDVDASQAGVFANLIPVVGVLSGILILKEPISMRAIIGGLIVMAGVWLTGSERAKAQPQRSA